MQAGTGGRRAKSSTGCLKGALRLFSHHAQHSCIVSFSLRLPRHMKKQIPLSPPCPLSCPPSSSWLAHDHVSLPRLLHHLLVVHGHHVGHVLQVDGRWCVFEDGQKKGL